MRNLLKRRPRDAAKPTLRERLTAAKAKYGRTLAVHRALNGPLPSAAPAPVDRIALVNYASWLFMERRMVCRELYPHMGTRADKFVLSNNAADRFHFPTCGSYPAGEPAAWKASDRAVKVLDLVGVDWRSDLSDARRGDLDPSAVQDDGKRPAVPHGWPRLDAEALEALDDLNRLDAAQIAMGVAGSGGERDADTVPGYGELEDARDDALDRLGKHRAESLLGLRVKGRALLTSSVSNLGGAPFYSLANSLARDLLGLGQNAIEPRPDPVRAVIEESQRLDGLHDALLVAANGKPSDDPRRPEERAAHDALWCHWRETVLTTVPQTADSCRALAAHTAAWFKRQGENAEDAETILGLIARSPLL